jgi:multicomponent Na+:H+ antiporter subunit G
MTGAEFVASGLIGAGLLFFLAGVVALRRFPDTLCRLHAVTKADNLGLGLVVAGLCVLTGGKELVLKLVAVYVLVLYASALNGYLLARNAYAETGEANTKS